MKSGEAFLVGSIFAVAAYDALQTETVEGHTVGRLVACPKLAPRCLCRRRESFLGQFREDLQSDVGWLLLHRRGSRCGGRNDTHVLVRLDGRAVTAV